MRKSLYINILLGGIFIVILLPSIHAQTNIVAISATSGTECLGNNFNFIIAAQNNDITNTSLLDRNMANMIDGTVGCLGCPGGGAFPALIFLSVQLTSGTVGAIDTFDLTLTDPAGFLNNSGVSSIAQTGTTITFRFTITANDQPTAEIVPADPVLCNGAPTVLTAITTNNSTVSTYTWSADGGNGSFQGDTNPGNIAAATITDPDTYRVTIANSCGSDSETTTATSDVTPVVDFSCQDNGDNTTTLNVDILNAATGVTVEFYNDGMFHIASGMLNGPTSTAIMVNSVTFLNQDFTIDAFNDCGSASNDQSCEILLPVELQYFDAKQEEKSVMLEWSTLSELNNDFFTLEKSINGIDFREVSTVQGAGTSQEAHYYSYLDEKAVERASGYANLYYRLKQTDFDGTYSYSDIKVVNLPVSGILGISNLWQESDNLLIDLSIPAGTRLEGRIISLDGRIIQSKLFEVSQGREQLSFDISNLPRGMYLFSASDNNTQISQKFIRL